MSGFSQPLTRINEGFVGVSPKALPLSQFDNDPITKDLVIRGNALEKEIEMLMINKKSLEEDIYNLTQNRDKDFRTITAELAGIKRLKDKLMVQVSSLQEVLELLNKARGEKEINFEDFFRGREDVLVKFAAAVSSRVDKRLKSAEERLQSVEEKEREVQKRHEDTVRSENEVSRALQRVAEAKQNLKFEAKRISEESEEVEKLKKQAIADARETRHKLTLAENTLSDAKNKIAEANKYVKEHSGLLEQQLEDVRQVAEAWKVKAQHQEREADRLKEWEKLLRDREGAIRRLASEVRSWQGK